MGEKNMRTPGQHHPSSCDPTKPTEVWSKPGRNNTETSKYDGDAVMEKPGAWKRDDTRDVRGDDPWEEAKL